MSNELLSYAEAAERLGVTVRSVRRRVRRGQLPAVPSGHHPNGLVEYAIPRAAIEGDPGVQRLPTGPAAPPSERVPLTHDGLPDLAAMRSMGLGAHADEWDRRMTILSELLALRARPDVTATAAVERVSRQYGESVRTLYRWRRLLLEGGPVALVPDWDGGRGETCLPVDLQLQIREDWLTSRRSTIRQTYQEIVLPYYRERGQDPPHYSTVRRFLRRHVLPLEEVALREGRTAYEAECAPKVVRDYPEEPNDWWCADHRLWDVLVVVADGRGTGWGRHGRVPCPCGSGRERRDCCSLRRPWVTLIADLASGGWVGWRLGLTPTAAGVCHAIRSAILRVGAPRHFYRDNGKEFTATRLGGRADRLLRPRQSDLDGRSRWPCRMPPDVESSGLWHALGIEVVTALPYRAWSKPVESFFRAFSLAWENWAPGWCGPSTEDKPEQLDQQVANGQVLGWDDFAAIFAERCNKWNREHTVGRRAGPPAQLYRAAVERGWEPRWVAEDSLGYLLQDRREVRVQTCGIVLRHQGVEHRYYSPELALYVGCTVRLRWDPEDSPQVYVITPDGRRLAVPRAQNAQYGEWGEANEAAAQGRRLQRQYLAARVEEAAGTTPPERLDPLGAVAMIRSREQRVAEEAAARTDAERRAAEEAALQRAAREAAERSTRERPRTVYDEDLRGIA